MPELTESEKAIFRVAVSLPNSGERQRFLRQACGSNALLLQQLERLLAADAADDRLLSSPAQLSGGMDGTSHFHAPSEQIGRYKLLQEIGEGGFGIVYMAEQQHPVIRRVALKIIKPGMDSKQVIARFEAERQALAMMDHPNIAKVFDAGATEQGRPYFAMELVRGVPITEYCDANKLTTTERLRLFVGVCRAVQHAHQKGVIHRDIKPNNVMITVHDDGAVPKIIDFGIAKATQHRLTEKTLFTEYAQLIGTPAYMSPEQAQMSGMDIDTRSDVYSLGALLYELLVGAPPFDPEQLRQCGYEELCRRIREDDPIVPSTRLSTMTKAQRAKAASHRQTEPGKLNKQFRGDLDWIVMKAMEKDRRRRYETASGLANDVDRFLRNDPVLAAAPTLWYQLRKLYARNRSAVSVLLAVILVLILGTVVSTWQSILATRANTRAEAEKNRAVRAEALIRRNLYAAEMPQAQRWFDLLNTRQTTQLLEKHIPSVGEPDLRGFEWRWLWNKCNQELFLMSVDSVGITRDKNFDFRDMRFSPDGKWLATGDKFGMVRLWNFETKAEVWQFRGGTHCNAVDFSRDGSLLLASFYKSIAPTKTFVWKITDPKAPQEIGRIESGVRFLPDGSGIVASSGAEYDLSGNRLRGPYIKPRKPGAQLWTGTYSPDWKTLATAHRIWDVTNRKLLKELPRHDGYADPSFNGVAISPVDGNLIVTGGAEGLRTWDRRGHLIREVSEAGGTPVGWLSFSQDGSLLAVRKYLGAVSVFATETWTLVDEFRLPEGNTVLFSPVDNNLLVAGGTDGVIRGYRVSSQSRPETILDHPAEVMSIKFSPDGRLLAIGMADGAVRFWELSSKSEKFTSPPTREVFGEFRMSSSFGPDFVAFSPDSKHVAMIGPERTIAVWDVANKKVIASSTDAALNYYAICFPKDGTQLFGSTDKRLDVWEWPCADKTLQFKYQQQAPWLKCMTVSGDGRYLAGSALEAGLSVWKLPGLERVVDVDESEQGVINLAFSPDGSQLATTLFEEVTLWDTDHWQPTENVFRHQSILIEHVSWSPNGRRLLTSGVLAATKLWDLDTMQVVATFFGTTSAFSPDGMILAVGGQGSKAIGDETHLGRVTLHYAPSLKEIDSRINGRGNER